MLKMKKKSIMIAQLALVLLNMVSVMQVLQQQPMLSQELVLNQVVGMDDGCSGYPNIDRRTAEVELLDGACDLFVVVVGSSIFVPPNLFLTVYTPLYPILPDIVKTLPIEILSYNSLLIPPILS